MIQPDIEKVLLAFKSKTGRHERFTSFDYCYNYFRNTEDLKKDVEKSCLMLGFYLASWGMFRGSSFLLQRSAWHFEATIDYIATLDRSVWKIDVDNYNENSIQQIIKIYQEIKDRLIVDRKAHKTLTSKVLLGVFGFVPAFDDYFTKTFREISGEVCRFRSVNENSLGVIKDFYEANKEVIDRWSKQTFTTDFLTGEKTTTNYPKAKIIDMYGFQRAMVARQAR
ncbi:MAG: hypothetical protein AB7V18_08825 [Pyrinomonadaceae bacterium]